MDPLARAYQPVHLQLLHAAVGPHAQLSARGAYLGKYELLQVRVGLENLPSHSSCHLEDALLVSQATPSLTFLSLRRVWLTGPSLIPRRAGNETTIYAPYITIYNTFFLATVQTSWDVWLDF